MYSNETELKEDVRSFTGYTATAVLSNDGLDTSYNRAKRRVLREKDLAEPYEWFGPDNGARQDALFWWTCLYTKVQTGELDSQDLQIGAIDERTLLAKGNDEATMWYREAQGALESIKPNSIIKSSRPIRNNRNYEAGSFDGGNNGGGSSTEVDGSNL